MPRVMLSIWLQFSSYGLGWYKYAIATQWYQFHTTDAMWFSLIIIKGNTEIPHLCRFARNVSWRHHAQCLFLYIVNTMSAFITFLSTILLLYIIVFWPLYCLYELLQRNILLQRQQNYGVWNDWYQKLLCCLCGNVYIDYIMVFGQEQEDGSFDYSHSAGTSSPSD